MICTQKSAMGLGMLLVVVLIVAGSQVRAQDVEVMPVNKGADLDLSGDILYAINFGNNGTPTFGDIVFSQDQDHPEIVCSISAEGQVDSWGAPYPDTGDIEMDMLLGGIIWTNSTGPKGVTTSISIGGLIGGVSYRLQLMFFTDHARPMDIRVDDLLILEAHDPYGIQRSVTPTGGSLVKFIFTPATDRMNITITNTGSDASLISGLIVTQASSFADYGSGTTTQLFAGGATWQLNWGQGPWTWSDSSGQPLLDSNASATLDLRTTASADISEDLMATLPIGGTMTVTAYDPNNQDIVIGTMVLSGAGVNVIDLNASRVLVDEGSGMFLAPFHAPDPKLTMTLDEATGVFAYVIPADDWQVHFAGSYAIPLIEGQALQDNIFSALGGDVALIGGIGEFELTGRYLTDESKRSQRFCEYGTGTALRFGAGGALWDQQWAGGPWDWHECPAEISATFLGENVSGELETTTAGTPNIDGNMVLSFDFGGHISLTKSNETNPDEPDGQILGDVDGTFVADLNAEHATIDTDGNIVIAFGASVHNAPDALITVTEATGVYADIQQAGQWAWYVNGVLAITRLPDLSVQDNIMAALQNNDLILHAEEEFVLTGWYYRDSQEQ